MYKEAGECFEAAAMNAQAADCFLLHAKSMNAIAQDVAASVLGKSIDAPEWRPSLHQNSRNKPQQATPRDVKRDQIVEVLMKAKKLLEKSNQPVSPTTLNVGITILVLF